MKNGIQRIMNKLELGVVQSRVDYEVVFRERIVISGKWSIIDCTLVITRTFTPRVHPFINP